MKYDGNGWIKYGSVFCHFIMYENCWERGKNLFFRAILHYWQHEHALIYIRYDSGFLSQTICQQGNLLVMKACGGYVSEDRVTWTLLTFRAFLRKSEKREKRFCPLLKGEMNSKIINLSQPKPKKMTQILVQQRVVKTL